MGRSFCSGPSLFAHSKRPEHKAPAFFCLILPFIPDGQQSCAAERGSLPRATETNSPAHRPDRRTQAGTVRQTQAAPRRTRCTAPAAPDSPGQRRTARALFHAEPAEQGEHHRQNQERRPVMADIRRGQNRAEQHGKQHRDARKPPPAEALALLGLCRLHRFAAQTVEPLLRALDARLRRAAVELLRAGEIFRDARALLIVGREVLARERASRGRPRPDTSGRPPPDRPARPAPAHSSSRGCCSRPRRRPAPHACTT